MLRRFLFVSLSAAACAAPAALFAVTAPASAAASPYTTELHGTIRAVDTRANLVTLHHSGSAAMMEMTMVVQMRDRRLLHALRPGARIAVRCDASRNPWVCVRK
jgi:Cu/Ag efflux protein CusF